jgi:hypothetical protein
VQYLLICSVAVGASSLTFFTGFGLGTLLLPAFAVFFPIDVAVALTAVVHFLNSVFKVALVGRRADFGVVLRFGLPAILAAVVGARLLAWLSDLPPVTSITIAGEGRDVTPVKLAVALLMVGFASMEFIPGFKKFAIPAKYLPVGGLLTGFFGGLSGHQGALRSAFLVRAGLMKEALIATGVVIAAAVDLTRIAVYTESVLAADLARNTGLLAAAAGSAFVGAIVGNRLLSKVTLRAIEIAVAVLLVIVAIGLAMGVL